MPSQFTESIISMYEAQGDTKCFTTAEDNPMYNQFQCSFNDLSNLPDLSVVVDGKEIYIPGKFLVQECVTSDNVLYAIDCNMNFEFNSQMPVLVLGILLFNPKARLS